MAFERTALRQDEAERLVRTGPVEGERRRSTPGLTPASPRVRSCEIELPVGIGIVDGARDGLFGGMPDI